MYSSIPVSCVVLLCWNFLNALSKPNKLLRRLVVAPFSSPVALLSAFRPAPVKGSRIYKYPKMDWAMQGGSLIPSAILLSPCLAQCRSPDFPLLVTLQRFSLCSFCRCVPKIYLFPVLCRQTYEGGKCRGHCYWRIIRGDRISRK